MGTRYSLYVNIIKRNFQKQYFQPRGTIYFIVMKYAVEQGHKSQILNEYEV